MLTTQSGLLSSVDTQRRERPEMKRREISGGFTVVNLSTPDFIGFSKNSIQPVLDHGDLVCFIHIVTLDSRVALFNT